MKTKILGLLAVMAFVMPVHNAAAITISSASPATFNFDLTGQTLTLVWINFTLPNGLGSGINASLGAFNDWDAGGGSSGGVLINGPVAAGFSFGIGSTGLGMLDGIFSIRLSTTSLSPLEVGYCVSANSSTAPCVSAVTTPVPEPGTLALLGLGLAGLGLSRRRKAA